jgi:gamma-tubulin complex component 3
MIEQSLCHHLQTQLNDYYRLIAVLETQMQSNGFLPAESNADPRAQETGVSLKRLDVWLNDWRLRMRLMSVCVEGAKGLFNSSYAHSYPLDSNFRGTGRCTCQSDP